MIWQIAVAFIAGSGAAVWLLFNWRVALVWTLTVATLCVIQMSLLTYAILIAARLMNGDVDVSYL